MRKLVPLLSAVSIAVLITTAGCGSSNSTVSTSGQQNAQGVTADQILIGSSGPLTGPAGAWGAVEEGVNAYFTSVNSSGGINGRKIKFTMLDDQYQPDLGVVNAKKLVADKVFAVVCPLGTSVLEAEVPVLLKAGIPIFGFATGSSEFAFPPNVKPMVWGFQPTYTLEGHVLLQFAAKNRGVKTIGVFYQNDDFGGEGLAALRQEAKADGVNIVVATPYNPTDTDVSTQAQTMVKAHPQAVFEFSAPVQTAQFMKDLQQLGYKGQQYLTDVTGDPSIMFPLAGSAFDNVYSDAWMPLPSDPQLKALSTEWKALYPNQPVSMLSEIGWVDAQVFAHAIQMCGNDLSWTNLEKQIDSIQNYTGAATVGPVSYSATDHAGTNEVVIDQADAATRSMRIVSKPIKYVETQSALQQ